jgi:hypothetical protein
MSTLRRELADLVWLLRMLVLLSVLGAIYTELRKPAAERTWHGRVLGIVPYDFRLPSLGRIRDAYWNPRSNRIFTDRPVGVGWAINVPAVLRRLGVIDGSEQEVR